MYERFEKKWGWYETLLDCPWYLVKKMYFYSGALMSLQRHFKRSEHWIIVEGRCEVFDDKGFRYYGCPNDHIFIEKGQWHSVSNSFPDPLTIIEIQFGSETTEEDIERLTESCMPGDEKYESYSKLVGRGYNSISTSSVD